MTNRDWIRRVLAHDGDVPVPYNLPLSPPAREKLQTHFGTDDVEGLLDLPTRMTGPKSIKPLYASPERYGPRVRDEFGVEWTTSRLDRGSPVGHPISRPDLDGYTFPDPADEYRFEPLGKWCRRNAERYTFLCAGDLWERATFLCGMENLLLWSALEPDFVDALLRRLADYILGTIDVLCARFDFDAVALSDDYGTQKSLVISPAAWRRLLKPRLAEIFARAKAAGKTTFLHSCGNVRQVVPDLVEIGLDVLHPIQPEALDILELKKTFGRDLTFCGGLGTQNVLARATPQGVRDEVRRLKRAMGSGGGYILEPGITIQADVPLANMLALIEEAGA